MSDVPVQVGTAVEVGFQGLIATGYLPEDGFQYVKSFSNMEEITDVNGATRTKVRTNPNVEWSGTLVVDSGTSWEIGEGDTLAITAPGGTPTALIAEVQTGTSVTFNRGAIKLQITLRKETSMTYTTSA